MKCGNLKIEIPGATDVLFFKDVSFETEGNGWHLAGRLPQMWGHTHVGNPEIPTSGKMIIKFYTSDDLEWIREWFNYVYYSYSGKGILQFHEMSNVSKAFLKRKIKLYNENMVFVFYEAIPCEIQYDEGIFHPIVGEVKYDTDYEKPFGIPTYVEITLMYSWYEKTFI